MKRFKFILLPVLIISTLLIWLYLNRSNTVIYLVRHAEKLNQTDTSGLTVQGLQRAIALKDTMQSKRLNLIYASIYRRTQLTVKPTADHYAKPIVQYDPDTSTQFIREIAKWKNKNILIAGHSDNVPAMVAELTGEAEAEIPSNVFNRLYKITIHKFLWTSVSLERMTYGAPSP